MLDFYGLITSYVAYFSTWQHENRVLETRFISLINIHSQNISDQRRTQKIKKNNNKNKKNRKREEPRQRTEREKNQAVRRCAIQAMQCTTQAKQRAIDLVFFFFFFFFFLGSLICSGQVPCTSLQILPFFGVFQIVQT